ncbi:MAG: hypothetical protein A3F98_01035 [Candidatus Yanofskybacteria bacterium RIFCSPLOWO2_12_FULL_41_8]|nr:MAG: hypothetical protein A3F98_01035 [Candidatus Yanofskybacteria bacterium RIFCSPLOWO2_12_FULL_41_8]
MKERNFIEKYEAVFSPTKAVEGLTHEQWLEKIPEVDAVIVLGSGLKFLPDEKDKLNLHGKMRTIAAYELYRLGKAKQIIVTGGVPIGEGYDRSMADAEEEYLIENLDAKPEDVIKEIGESSESTIENFENILDILKSKGIKTAIIVSNGYHIPRAEALFKKISIQHNLSIEVMGIPAEEILLERSTHYKKLVEHYDIAKKALEHPGKIRKYIEKEGIGLFLAHVDRNDTIARNRSAKRKKENKPDAHAE